MAKGHRLRLVRGHRSTLPTLVNTQVFLLTCGKESEAELVLSKCSKRQISVIYSDYFPPILYITCTIQNTCRELNKSSSHPKQTIRGHKIEVCRLECRTLIDCGGYSLLFAYKELMKRHPETCWMEVMRACTAVVKANGRRGCCSQLKRLLAVTTVSQKKL